MLAAWEEDPAAAQQLIHAHTNAAAKMLESVMLATRLLLNEMAAEKEQLMSSTINEAEMSAVIVVSIRRHIAAPAYHEWIMPALRQLWSHSENSESEAKGNPLTLFCRPLNEKDGGPVEICVPFSGGVLPKGDIKVRGFQNCIRARLIWESGLKSCQ